MPRTDPRKLIQLTPELVDRITAYRQTQKPIPSENQAVRDLLAIALALMERRQARLKITSAPPPTPARRRVRA